MVHKAKVRVPATTANLGPGFDTFGMAFQMYNTVEIIEIDSGLEIIIEGEGKGDIPLDESNIVYKAIDFLFKKADYSVSGMKLVLNNEIPVERGLGSSAASILGGIMAANEFIGNRFSKSHLLDWAIEIEGHPDNIAPAMFGGVVVSISDDTEKLYKKIAIPNELSIIAVIPDFKLATRKARAVLPDVVKMEDAIFNLRRATVLVAALMEGDLPLFGRMMQDRLHHPFREILVPGMSDVFNGAINAGALSVALSGAGSTIVAFTDKKNDNIGKAMIDAFKKHNITARIVDLKPDNIGAKIIS